MKGIKISSRYAKSLLILAVEKQQLDAVYADMKLIHSTIESSRDLRIMLNSPVIKPDTKVAVLSKIFVGEIGEVTYGFIKLLTEKTREGYLGEVAESFLEQVKVYKNVVTAEIISASAMDENTRKEVMAIVARLKKGDIELAEKVDPSLIGGFVLRVGDNMIDTSLSTSIRNLRREFDDNPYIPEL